MGRCSAVSLRRPTGRWGLRSYGTIPQVWDGDPACSHNWSATPYRRSRSESDATSEKQKSSAGSAYDAAGGSYCSWCGAWRGEYGAEPTPEMYVEHTVSIFREVRRVLRDDGTLFLNLGETFSKKQLIDIPSLVALALQKDGWWYRSRLPWLKRNPMPSSVTDRPASAVEYIFLLTKSSRYYYDGESIKLPQSKIAERPDWLRPRVVKETADAKYKGKDNPRGGGLMRRWLENPEKFLGGRNFRNSDLFFDSWQGLYDEGEGPLAMIVNPQGFPGAHFATFSERLVVPLIKAGTSEKGCCPKCSKPYKRIVDKNRVATRPGANTKVTGDPMTDGNRDPLRHVTETQTIGWSPQCKCSGLPIMKDPPKEPHKKKDESDADFAERLAQWEKTDAKWRADWDRLSPQYAALPVMPCVCFDPFFGSGTVGLVAAKMGRRYIGLELNPEYAEMAKRRIGQAMPLFT